MKKKAKSTKESDKKKESRDPDMPGLVLDEDSDDEQENDSSPKKIDYQYCWLRS